MAQVREYGYYVKGEKIALVEREVNFDNDPDSRTYGPGVDRGEWKSPLATVSGGLKVEYAYSPEYTIETTPTINVNKFFVNGWTVSTGGNLIFVRNDLVDNADWTSNPEGAAEIGEYILVEGSSRWNGLHKISARNDKGELYTHTKVNQNYIFFQQQDLDFNTSQQIFDGGGSSNIALANHFNAGDYIFISDAASAQNNGVYKIGSTTITGVDTTSRLKVSNKYHATTLASMSITGDVGVNELENEGSTDPDFAATSGSGTVTNIRRIEREHCSILTDINVLEDDDDEIDIPAYLEDALVYYIKAKMQEEMGNIELREYFMKQFNQLMEKHATSRQWGARMVSSGPFAIR